MRCFVRFFLIIEAMKKKCKPWFLDRINTFAFDSVQKYVKSVTDGEMFQNNPTNFSAFAERIFQKAIFLKNETTFRFLKGGCSRTPVELLKLVGLDMEEPEVVNEAVKVFKDLLDEMEELA